MTYLLDSNIVIAGLDGDPKVLDRLAEMTPDDAILCAPVLAELEFGAPRSSTSQLASRSARSGRVVHRPLVGGRITADMGGRNRAVSDKELARQGRTADAGPLIALAKIGDSAADGLERSAVVECGELLASAAPRVPSAPRQVCLVTSAHHGPDEQ